MTSQETAPFLTDAGLFSVTFSFIEAEGYCEKGVNREAAVVLSKGVFL